MATLDDVSTLMSEANTALGSGDYDTAELKAVSAQGLLAALPNQAAKSGFAGGSQGFRHETINEFLENVRKLRARAVQRANAASGGIVMMPIEMRKAGCNAE
ncbi:MAG: hypothetical protein R3C03_23995 [Pirellulaceae bacterium]